MDKETKEEFESLARIVQGGFLELKDEINSVRTELKADIVSVRTELKEEIASVRSELKEEIALTRSELKEDISVLDIKTSRIDRRTENQADSLYEDMHGLKDRVNVVEEKVGIVPPKPKLATA